MHDRAQLCTDSGRGWPPHRAEAGLLCRSPDDRGFSATQVADDGSLAGGGEDRQPRGRPATCSSGGTPTCLATRSTRGYRRGLSARPTRRFNGRLEFATASGAESSSRVSPTWAKLIRAAARLTGRRRASPEHCDQQQQLTAGREPQPRHLSSRSRWTRAPFSRGHVALRALSGHGREGPQPWPP